MASGDHKRGDRKNNFCWIPADSPCGDCGTSDNYRKACEGETSGWGSYEYKEKSSAGSYMKGFEAHHLLCVDSVGTAIAEVTDSMLSVSQTKWCINHKVNMMAMPLWGHTVKYYCDMTASKPGKGIAGVVRSAVMAPPGWANIPQHDHDHNCTGGYRDEVTAKVKATLEKVKLAGHKVEGPGSLKASLDKLSGKCRTLLQKRGIRGATVGTHAVWIRPPGPAGKNWPPGDWYLPYSMADDGIATGRPLPRREWDTKTVNKLISLIKKMKG